MKRLTWERSAQLAMVLLCALALKLYYSTANVNELRWILAPTTRAVELISSSRFAFESYAGYVSSDRTFVIAASCAGVNFLIAGFLMLSLAKLWRAGSNRVAWRFFPGAAACAYLATIIANTVRITTALQLHGRSLETAGLGQNDFHRLQGIFIYFGFLLLLFVLSERFARNPDSRSTDRTTPFSSQNRFNARSPRLLRKFFFPLAIYYATTLGLPLANAFRQGSTTTGFWEHAGFVFLTPLIFIIPFAMFHLLKVGES
jgi:exosortase K